MDPDDISPPVQVILKGNLTPFIQDYAEDQPVESKWDWIRFEELTFSCRTKEHNGVVLPEPVVPEPGGVLCVLKRNIVTGGS